MLSDSKDDLVLRALELLKKRPRPHDTGSTIRPGSVVAWQRGDGSKQEAFVDFCHTDTDGKQWVFVSWGKTWAAVNLKFLTVVTT